MSGCVCIKVMFTWWVQLRISSSSHPLSVVPSLVVRQYCHLHLTCASDTTNCAHRSTSLSSPFLCMAHCRKIHCNDQQMDPIEASSHPSSYHTVMYWLLWAVAHSVPSSTDSFPFVFIVHLGIALLHDSSHKCNDLVVYPSTSTLPRDDDEGRERMGHDDSTFSSWINTPISFILGGTFISLSHVPAIIIFIICDIKPTRLKESILHLGYCIELLLIELLRYLRGTRLQER